MVIYGVPNQVLIYPLPPTQYMFVVPKPETEVMISLLQKDVRDQSGLKANHGAAATKTEETGLGENFTIGFYVMKVRIPYSGKLL